MISRNGAFYADVGNVTSASVPLFGGITGIKVWAYNNTVALTGPTTLVDITLDQTAPGYLGFSPAVYCIPLNMTFGTPLNLNYSEPVWHAFASITNGGWAFIGVNGSLQLAYSLNYTNILFNSTLAVTAQDKAGNTDPRSGTFLAPLFCMF